MKTYQLFNLMIIFMCSFVAFGSEIDRPPALNFGRVQNYDQYINRYLANILTDGDPNLFEEIWDCDRLYNAFYRPPGMFTLAKVKVLAKDGWCKESHPREYDFLQKVKDQVKQLFYEKAVREFTLQLSKDGDEPFYSFKGNPANSVKLAECGLALLQVQNQNSDIQFQQLLVGMLKHSRQLEGSGSLILEQIGRTIRLIAYEMLRSELEKSEPLQSNIADILALFEDTWPTPENLYKCMPVDWATGLDTLGWSCPNGKVTDRVEAFGMANFGVIKNAVNPSKLKSELDNYYHAAMKLEGKSLTLAHNELKQLWSNADIPLVGKQPFPHCLFVNYDSQMQGIKRAMQEHAVLLAGLAIEAYFKEFHEIPNKISDLTLSTDESRMLFIKQLNLKRVNGEIWIWDSSEGKKLKLKLEAN